MNTGQYAMMLQNTIAKLVGLFCGVIVAHSLVAQQIIERLDSSAFYKKLDSLLVEQSKISSEKVADYTISYYRFSHLRDSEFERFGQIQIVNDSAFEPFNYRPTVWYDGDKLLSENVLSFKRQNFKLSKELLRTLEKIEDVNDYFIQYLMDNGTKKYSKNRCVLFVLSLKNGGEFGMVSFGVGPPMFDRVSNRSKKQLKKVYNWVMDTWPDRE